MRRISEFLLDLLKLVNRTVSFTLYERNYRLHQFKRLRLE
jgi:hypothetical protein